MTEIIDPTKNVLDLVHAAMRRQDDMRAAETRRTNELDALRERYETRIADILREEVKSTSLLLSTQLERFTTTLSTRISELERFRYEIGGKAAGRSDVVAWSVTGATVLISAATLAVTFILKH